MDDRELLELAAKAAGIEIKPMEIRNVTMEGDDRFIGYMTDSGQWPSGWFNPLRHDDEAFRLAVKLRMLVDSDGVVYAIATATPKGTGVQAHEKHGSDRYAATRRAIVRAAAELGRIME